MFSKRLPLAVLADWCRSIASSMAAGVTLPKALSLSARRGTPKVRKLSRGLLDSLEAGADVEGAFQANQEAFPPLFTAMVAVASRTGHLPETLRRLEDYFRFQLRLRRRFVAQIFWPVFQLVAAILIIALLIYVLGVIADTQGQKGVPAIDFLGLGLRGPIGALIWLVGSFGSIALVVGGIEYLRRRLDRAAAVDSLLLGVPTLGPCLQTLAEARLCFALELTLEGGMSLREALPLSLRATNNGAFSSQADRIRRRVTKEGHTLSEAFEETGLFSPEFLEVLRSGEESGTVPESMQRLAVELNEQAEHRLALLNTAVGWLVWAVVACLIVFFIFRMFLNYIRLLESVQI